MDTKRPLIPGGSEQLARIPALDGLRGVAVLWVMVHHFVPAKGLDFATLNAPIVKLLRLGWVGVELFFVLSGFLITRILLDTRNCPNRFSAFYLRRALRIFPVYYGALTLVFLVFPLLRPGVHPGLGQAWYWLFACNIGQSFGLADSGSQNFNLSHFWSLAVEEHFYLVWPFLVYFLSERTMKKICVGLVVLAMVCRTAMLKAGFGAYAVYLLTPCRIDGLAVGSFIALAARSEGGLASLRRPALGLLIALGALSVPFLFRSRAAGAEELAPMVFKFTALAVLFGSLLVMAANRGNIVQKICSMPPLRVFGKYSYGLYVFHFLFIFWLGRLVPVAVLRETLGRPAAIALYVATGIAASFTIAFASWHLYEKRFLQRREVWARWESNPHDPKVNGF